MKQRFLLLQLAFRLGFMFIGEMFKELMNEWKNNAYPQSEYNSCLERAMAMINKAMERPVRYYACLIAHHRDKKHLPENHSEEIKQLEDLMPVRDVKSVRKSRIFWVG